MGTVRALIVWLQAPAQLGLQTRFVNRQETRSGTLWEGRYQSNPIKTDADLLAGCRYVELNPVRARITDAPASYPWSSDRRHVGTDDTLRVARHRSVLRSSGIHGP